MCRVAEPADLCREASDTEIEAHDRGETGRYVKRESPMSAAFHATDLRLRDADRARNVRLSKSKAESRVTNVRGELVQRAPRSPVRRVNEPLTITHAPMVRERT